MSNWTDDLPEPLRDAPFIQKAESAEAALAALKHAGNHVGNSIRFPDKEASEDSVNEFIEETLSINFNSLSNIKKLYKDEAESLFDIL